MGAILLLSPSLAAAHVTRLVGPYTFLIVLIEEPYFQDNHAGFEFWVRDGHRGIDGLDRTLEAEAIAPGGATVKLTIGPRNDRGFYDAPFYPGSGGQYWLHLAGSVEGMPIDERFLVTFPPYPRTPMISSAEAEAGTGTSIPAGAAALALGAAIAVGFWVVRRRRWTRTLSATQR
jgi:hypothetical protein